MTTSDDDNSNDNDDFEYEADEPPYKGKWTPKK